jgi:hypothetical protein
MRRPGSRAALAEHKLRGGTSAADASAEAFVGRGSRRAALPLRAVPARS